MAEIYKVKEQTQIRFKKKRVQTSTITEDGLKSCTQVISRLKGAKY